MSEPKPADDSPDRAPVETPPEPQAPPPPPEPTPQPEAPAPAPPPAALIVQNGTKTEREIELERAKRELETRVSCLEDENHQLKAIPRQPSPPQARKSSKWTYFDED